MCDALIAPTDCVPLIYWDTALSSTGLLLYICHSKYVVRSKLAYPWLVYHTNPRPQPHALVSYSWCRFKLSHSHSANIIVNVAEHTQFLSHFMFKLCRGPVPSVYQFKDRSSEKKNNTPVPQNNLGHQTCHSSTGYIWTEYAVNDDAAKTHGSQKKNLYFF